MEEIDPELQWEIQEYSSSKAGNENTMMKWILHKGYEIGKKMAVTGIAISAAPLVLPPIVVFSAMGVAFSIPSGFVFASYACTNKLMTTLLPIPPLPVLSKCYTDEDEKVKRQMDELEKSHNLDEYEDECISETVNEDEERWQIEDTKQGVEMSRRSDIGTNTNFGGGVDEQGYEEDIGEYLEGDDDGLGEEHEGDMSLLETRHDENESLRWVVTEDGKEEILEESTGIVEKVREEGRVDDDTTEDDYFLDGSVSNVLYEAENEVEKIEPIKVIDGSVEDNMTQDDYFLDGSPSNFISGEIKDVETTTPIIVGEIETKKRVNDGSKNIKPMVISSPGNEGHNFNSIEVEELDVMAREVVRDIDHDGENIDSDEKVTRAGKGTQKETRSDIHDEGTEDTCLRKRKDHLILANVDAKKMDDETGSDLFDDQNTSMIFEGLEARGEAKGIIDENVDELERGFYVDEYEDECTLETVNEDEERGQIEDTNKGVEMSLRSEIGANINFGGGVDEQGYGEDIGEYLEGDDDGLKEEHEGEMSLLESRFYIREEDDDGLEEEHTREESLLETRHDENENLRRVVTEDGKEEILEERRVDDDATEDDYFLDGSVSNVLYEAEKEVEKREPSTVFDGRVEDNMTKDDYFLDGSASNFVSEEIKDVKTAKPVRFNEISVEDNTIEDAETTEPIIVRETETKKQVNDGSKNNKPIVVISSPGNEGNNFNSRKVEELDLLAREVVGDIDHDGENIDNYTYSNSGGEAKGIVDENVDILGLPTFRREPLHTDNAEVTSKTDSKMPSREDTLNDKMIWEEVRGKRAIEHKVEEILLNTKLDENKGKESFHENRLGEENSKTQEVTTHSLEYIVEECTGLLENVRDKGRVSDNTTVDDYFFDGSASNVVPKEVKDETREPEDTTIKDDYFLDESGSNVVLEKVEEAETTGPVIVREIETQKVVKDGIKNNKPIGEMHCVVILSPGNEGDNFNATEVEELNLVAREVVGDIDQDGGNIDSEEKIMRASIGTQEETGSNISYERTEDASLRIRQDHLIHANVDARKMDDDTDLDLFVDQNTSMHFEGLAAGGEAKGTVDENVYVLELPALRGVPLDTDNAEVTSTNNTETPSREDALNDKMIWEKIEEKRDLEYKGGELLLNSRLDENKGKEPLFKSRLGEDKSKAREVTKDSLEDIVKGSTGLLENIRGKGRVDDNTVEDDHFSVSNVVFEEIKESEETEPVTVKGIETEIRVMGGLKNNKTIEEMRHVVLSSVGNEPNNINLRVEELDLVSREVVGDFHKDASFETKKGHLIHTSADVGKMGDESGLDSFDDQKTGMKFQSRKGGGASKETVVDENVDVLSLPPLRRVLMDTDNGTVTSKTNGKTPSREDGLDDEKIWEKIGAMRTIVGYNVPSQPTCMGELKALYVFTGVEPPASLEGDTGLDEVNAKLKFLMAIVGVK